MPGFGTMRGRVLGVDSRTGDGVVAGDDGHRYTFRPADWAARGEPAVGIEVDFETERNRALSLFPLPVAPTAVAAAASPSVGHPPRTDRNKYLAALLAFVLGPFGVHRFYLGRTGSGIAMLILSITLVGILVSVPWAVIDTFRLLFMPDDEFARRYAHP